MVITGGLAIVVRKKKSKCCNFFYAFLLPPVFVLMVVSAIPIFMVNSVSEASIDKLCQAAAGDN